MDIADFADRYIEDFTTTAVTNARSETPPASTRQRCVECNEPIPAQRRNLVRGCTLCVECASRKERRSALFAEHNPEDPLSTTEILEELF
jgi:phage/conjugal plasmid C-4 type zinc finger TraR family protein